MHKLAANAVFFSTPMPKIYKALPPSLLELDEVLAFVYLGPTRPTEKEFKRTPLLVCQNKVAMALEWLKLNHIDYTDLNISYENLNTYPENEPPIQVDYHFKEVTEQAENSAVTDMETDNAVSDGECPFIVHGLTGIQIESQSAKALRAIALKHMLEGGKALGIGYSEKPESIYNNPQLYPQIFPWLFPYGLGGIGNDRGLKKVTDKVRKQQLLMYFDKRFQMEPMFPLVAFNHEQIKSSVTGGYLIASKANFPAIASRLMRVNQSTLSDLTERLKNGEHVKPMTDDEKLCYQIINDLDHVAHHVQGSKTNRKYM